MAFHEPLTRMVADLVAGAWQGQLDSIAILAVLALLLLQLILPGGVFRLAVRLSVFGIVMAATWLGYQHALATFDPVVAYVVLAGGGLLALTGLAVMGSNTRQERWGPEPLSDEQAVAGGHRPGEMEAGQATARRAMSMADAPEPEPEEAQGGVLARLKQLDPTQGHNVLSVIAFMVIAEFGVLSSVTVTADDPVAGAIFFAVVHLAVILYIATSYHHPKQGIKRYAVVAVASVVVALALYYTWTADPVPIDGLLPWGFFTEATMVASVTGVAFSLVISGQG